MSNFKRNQLFIPVFIATLAGLVAITGSTYFFAQPPANQEETSVLGIKKIPSPTPTVKLSKDAFIYKSEALPNQTINPPGFTINPPAGYIKQSNPNYKVLFFSAKKDEQKIAKVGTYKMPARILVNLLDLRTQPGFSELEKRADYSDDKMLKAINAISIIDVKNSVVLNDLPAQVAGQESRILEYKASTLYGGKYEIWEHIYMVMFVKNGYLVVASGGSLESAWSKRAGEIKASLNTFTVE